MTLVELTRKWKDETLTDEEVIQEYENIDIYVPEEIDGEYFYTRGDDNSWLDVTTDNYLTRKERIKFKRKVGAI